MTGIFRRVLPGRWRVVPFLALAALPAAAAQDGADDGKPVGARIVEAARARIGTTVLYDPAYRSLEYPGGDVPDDRGVCTDVVVRALRKACGFDLQKAVHEDMRAHFPTYPKIWGLRSTDRNIDHRRVPNLMTFFKRRGWRRQGGDDPSAYRPGDLVTCTVPPNRPHIMVVSDRRAPDGTPLVIHNIGSGTREEDRLFDFPLTGHFRVDLPTSPSRPEAGS